MVEENVKITFMKLKVGQKAPDFKLRDQNGDYHKLSSYKGKWVLLYFYPRDNTPGCTKEACGIRDNFKDFKKLEVEVLGVSTDSVESHKRFSSKYSLSFTLLSDEGKVAVKNYGVWGKKKFLGREFQGTLRTSFLIDPKGKIAKIYEKVNPLKHAKEVIDSVKIIKGGDYKN